MTQLFAAIDVADGRLARASGAGEVDPLELALSWRAAGLTWVHLVDLDRAYGRGANAALIAELVSRLRTAGASVQLSGGVASAAALRAALDSGADRVNLATTALNDLAWCAAALAQDGPRLSLSLDVVLPGDGEPRLSARGGGGPDLPLWPTVARLTEAGAGRFVVTDNSRDGQLSGPNLALLREFRDRCSAEVVASGGVASLADLRALGALRLAGVIVGRALLDGALSLPEALAVVAESSSPGYGRMPEGGRSHAD